MLNNIERSAFHRGEYVGYAFGAWRINRCDAGWQAFPPANMRDKGAGRLAAPTLDALGDALKRFEAEYDSRPSFRADDPTTHCNDIGDSRKD